MSELLVDDSYKNIRIKIDGQVVATQEIIDRISIAFGCTDGSAPAVGTTFSPHCDVEINSNEIYGDSNLDAIKMGVIFIVECEFESGVYSPLGRFEIGQPVQYTDDYSISFSGEGMLGSVLSRKKMNWANMEQYTDKGVLTVAEALELVHIQFPTITIQTPSSEHLPDDFSEARIVVPTSLKKWKKNVIYKKRFVKITVRDFLAGIAVMMGGNVVEYGNSIRIVTMSEARENEGAMIGNYFSSDSFASDFTYERKVYVPKEVCLKTYETTPVQTKKKSGSAKTHGYCYTTECECASVYKYEGAPSVHKYTINVDCQWIGRSFEAFYFSGSVSGDSGEYEDAEPIRTYPLIDFNYLPCSIDFSGWNDLFRPATFVNIHATRKNTATQEETPFDVLVYIMDMTFEWNGTISVSVSSGYNGDSSEITVTIGTNELSNAWDDGTNIPEMAEVIITPPEPQDWNPIQLLPSSRIPDFGRYSFSGYLFDNDEVHILYRNGTTGYRHFVYSNGVLSENDGFVIPDNYLKSGVIKNGKIHGVTNKRFGNTWKTVLYDDVYDTSHYIDFPNSHDGYQSNCVMAVYNEEIHIIFLDYDIYTFKHYKLSNGEIVLVTDSCPVQTNYIGTTCTVMDDSIYLYTPQDGYILRFDGSVWEVHSSISETYNFNHYYCITSYNGYLHIFVFRTTNSGYQFNGLYHYYWDDEWIYLNDTYDYLNVYSVKDFFSFAGVYDNTLIMCGVGIPSPSIEAPYIVAWGKI